MTIRTKLIGLCAGMLALMLVLGLFAIQGLARTNEAFATTYHDRVLPLDQLKVIADMYAVNIVDTTHKVNHGQLNAAQGLELVKKARQTIDEQWQKYTATSLTGDEVGLVKEATEARAKADAKITELEGILTRSDAAALDQFARLSLYGAIDPVSGVISKLVEVQLREAKNNYTLAQDNYASIRGWAIGLMLAALLFGGAYSAWLAINMNRKIEALRSTLNLARDQQDLTQRAAITGKDEIDSIAQSYNELTGKMQSLVGNVAQAIDTVTQEVQKLATASEQVAQATHLGSESTSSMAAAVEEVTVAITHVADSADYARELGNHTRQQAQDSSARIGETVREIQGIDAAVSSTAEKVAMLGQDAAKISNIVVVIKDVAEQTNLLALNAAIEAARAGDMGRGFAVVADEVRKLAERTASATVDIQQMVSHIGQTSNDAVSSIAQTVQRAHECATMAGAAGEAIAGISRDATAADDSVSNIAMALNEQKTGAQLIAQQVERVAQMTDENTAAVASMSDSAQALGDLTQRLRTEVNLFRYS